MNKAPEGTTGIVTASFPPRSPISHLWAGGPPWPNASARYSIACFFWQFRRRGFARGCRGARDETSGVQLCHFLLLSSLLTMELRNTTAEQRPGLGIDHLYWRDLYWFYSRLL